MIMYRNPLEQWFWEGGALYVFLAFVITFVVIAAYYYIKQMLCKHSKAFRRPNGTYKCFECEAVLRQSWVKPIGKECE